MTFFYDLNKRLNALGADKTAQLNEAKGAKPDFLDLDGDGDTKEPMKKAAQDAKHKFKKTMEAAKPDFLDLDNDGDTEEPMKKAAADAKKKKPVNEAEGEFTQADWDKVARKKRHLMILNRNLEPEDAEQMAAERLGYDYEDVLAWIESDQNMAEAVKEIPGGRRHTAEPGGYGRKSDDDAPKPVVKKGRGRPRKGSDSETGEVMKPDWSAFGVGGKVKLPKHTGAVTKHKMVGEGDDADVEAAVKMLKKAGYTVTKGDTEQVDEKAVSKKQQKFMGMVHAAKKGDKPASPEVAKAAKGMSGKEAEKFASTKHKGLPEKKKKDESVEETTTSGSVAPAADAPKSAKGMSFGKGIYDSWNRELEGMIAESINVSVNMNTGSETGAPTKNITVSAEGDDADRLAELLQMAGLGTATAAKPEVTGDCGAEPMEEQLANSASNTEYSDDAFQYSGGLNRPKSTGQTTVPVIASQTDRQSTEEEIEETYDPYFDPESRESQKYKEPRDDIDPDSDDPYDDELDEIALMKERAGISDGRYTQDYFTANRPSADRQRAEADREQRPNTPFSRDPIEATTDRAIDRLSQMFKSFKKK
jgi:hypothetical protein